MIKFQELTIENFLSHEATKVNLDNRGLVLILGINADTGGSNAAGKTTLLAALVFCLYGQTPEDVKADEVIRTGQSSCKVSISGTNGSDSFVITRTRGPAGLTLESNGKDISGPSIRETQGKIESYLGLDYKSFISTVLFPQGAKGLASLPQAEQREILGRILDLERFDEAFSRIKSHRESLYTKQADLQAQQARIQIAIESELRHLNQLENGQKSFKEQQEIRLRNLRIELANLVFPEIPDGIQKLIKTLDSEDPIHANQRLSAEYAIFERSHQTQLTKLAGAKSRYQTLLETLREPQDHVKQDCSECGQALPEKARASLVERHRAQLIDYLAKKEDYSERLKLIDQEEVQIKVQRATADLDFGKRREEIEAKVRRLTDLRNKLQQFKAVDLRKQSIESSIEDEESRCWTGSTAIKETKATIAKLEKQLPEIADEHKKVTEELEYADFWHEGFGSTGLRHFFLASITPYLSDRANYYLGELTSGTGKVSITTQRQTKKGHLSDELTIEAELGGGTSYKAKSGGEKRRIDVALLFALAELMASRARVNTNVLFLDEILDNLDHEGVTAVLVLLKAELAKHKESIFLISHNSELQSEVEQVMVVEKRNGISKVIQNG